MLRQGTDAGNGKILLQLIDVAIAVDVDEVDDVVHVENLTTSGPPIALAACLSFTFELDEVRENALGRHRHERRRERRINPRDNFVDARESGAQRLEHLLLAQMAMLDVLPQQFFRFLDNGAVGGKHLGGMTTVDPFHTRSPQNNSRLSSFQKHR